MHRFYQRRQKLPEEMVEQKLPEEMVEEVILRLPPKDVGRLRKLSKAWNSRLSSPEFVRAHSKFHMNRGSHEIIISNLTYGCVEEPLFTFPDRDGSLSLVPSHLFGEHDHASVEASCYGFVIVEIKTEGVEEKRMLLFNPTTKNAIEIPPFKSLAPKKSRYFLGLGYDSSSDDYKLLRLSKSSEFYGTFVDIYSFKMKTWRSLGESRYHVHDATHGDGVFINGCLHWCASDKDNKSSYIIVGFDLAKEEFKEIPSPVVTSGNAKECSDDSSEGEYDDDDDDSEEDSDDSSEDFDGSFKGFDSDSDVAVFKGGCLAVINNPEDKAYIEMWVMREYGVQESWKKLVIPIDREIYRDDPGLCYGDREGIFRFVCLSEKDKLIFMKHSSEDDDFPINECNLSTGKWKDVAVQGEEFEYSRIEQGARVVSFRECLLSPDLL